MTEKANAASAQKLVVVLGMHRSGTSATTRALKALGADFGDNLLQPIPGVNDKGFFEDLDVLQLNTELLAALGMEWHSVGEIDLSVIDPAVLDAFQTRAIAMMRAKCKDKTFALKDPRLARLMPFWQPVFACVGVQVVYVIAVRNPISVAKSLAKRNGFADERSHLMWLAHVVPALVDTHDCVRTIVDYDQLLDDPKKHVERMGAALGLSVDRKQVSEFSRDFLAEGLRHTRFEVQDLDPIRSAPHSLKQLYAALDEASRTGEAGVALDEAIKAGQQYLADLAPLLRYEAKVHRHVSQQNTAVAQRDQQLAAFQAAVTQREQQIAAFQTALAQREQQLAAFQTALAERDQRIAELESVLAQVAAAQQQVSTPGMLLNPSFSY